MSFFLWDHVLLCTPAALGRSPYRNWDTFLRANKNLPILSASCLEIRFSSNKLWKILKEMGIPDHLTCLLRNLFAGQEATVRTGHGTTDWFQIGKGVHQGCILSSCLLTYMQNTSCEMPGWMKHKLQSRLLGEISITSDMQMTPPSWQKVKRN